MGFFIMLLVWLFLWAAATAAVSYVMDSCFLAFLYRRTGKRPLILCWMPFYGQYQMGKYAGLGWAGRILALCHVTTALCLLSAWIDLSSRMTNVVNGLFYPSIFLGFVLKEWIVHRLLGKRAGKWRLLIHFIDVATMGFTRSIVLFLMRKRVDFSVGNGTE